jgi:hypothetical protein
MSALKTPKNLRDIVPRCCATCKYRNVLTEGDEGYLDCEREEGTIPPNEDIYHMICDYYKTA